MQKHILTQEDLDNNPELIEQGLEVGDEVDLPLGNNLGEDENAYDGDPLPPKTPPVTPPLA